MVSAFCSLVRRKEPIGGGIVAAIAAIVSSPMTPGPLGIADTRPKAEAPQAIASAASSTELMQQILIRGERVGRMRGSPTRRTEPRYFSPGSHAAGTIALRLASCQTSQWHALRW